MPIKVTIKETVRHVLHWLGLQSLTDWFRKRRGYDTTHFRMEKLSDRFDYIYVKRIWKRPSEAPLSGFGSSLEATTELRQKLPDVLEQVGAQSILDIGCGDFTWMSEIALSQKYVGVDIVASVIEENRARYPDHVFHCLDATTEALPMSDVVICREVLFHLAFADIWRLLNNVRASGSQYFLTTSDRSSSVNADIPSGDFRPLNLEKKPFSLPPPIVTIDDSHISSQRFMGLWRVADIPAGH